MDWDDLRIFLSVSRHDSLSAAARALRLDPATAGRRVARLEQSLGAALFVKSSQGYRLTEAGERLRTHAEAAERAAAAARAEIAGPAGRMAGAIRLGAPDGCANYLLPRICARLARAHPALDIQVVALPRVIDLSRREADLAIAVSRPETGRLKARKISDYHLSLAAHPGYLAEAPALESVADLKAHRMVGYIPDMIFDSELDYFGALGIERVALASTSVAVQFQMLRAGAGIGMVHDFARPEAPELARVLPGAVRLTRSFWLVRHAVDAGSPRLDAFARALTTEMRAEIAAREAAAG